MPNDLVLVRHGESEGNLADDLYRAGQEERANAFFANRHTSEYRLTDRGRSQAQAAGRWLKANLPGTFNLAYSSDFARARETAGQLAIEGQIWHVTFNLREREHGVMRDLRGKEKLAAEEAHAKQPFYWRPLNGESVADICVRVDRVLETVRKRNSGQRVIIVCHAEVMRAFRVRIEHILPEEYKKFNKTHPYHHIHNGQVLHYTRRDPASGEVQAETGWVRSVCPWDKSLSSNDWEGVGHPVFSSLEMLREVERIQQVLNNQDMKEEPRRPSR